MTALPSALARFDDLAGRLATARPALFLDYDGTLTPIVARPELAVLSPATRDLLERLIRQGARPMPIAILSGRGREDVAALVGLPPETGIVYAGSHGFDIAGPGFSYQVGGQVGGGLPEQVARAAEEISTRLAGIAGTLVEDKRFAVAIHYRLVADADLPAVERAVDAVAAAHPELRKSGGKKVFELRPTLDWDKGRALLWILDRLDYSDTEASGALPHLPIFLGDDVTDEDAFRAVAGRGGIGVLVADEPRPTAAGYSLRDPDEVRQLLSRLTSL